MSRLRSRGRKNTRLRFVKEQEKVHDEELAIAGQLQVDVASVTGVRYTLAAKCQKLALEVQIMPELTEKAKVLRARLEKLEDSSNGKLEKAWGWLKTVTWKRSRNRFIRSVQNI